MTSPSVLSTIQPKPTLKFPPWIIAVLSLIYTVIVQFLFIASLEKAFPYFENLFETLSSNIWLVEIPIPLIVALIVFYSTQKSRTKNINSFVLWSTALGAVLLGLIVYAIIYQYPIAANSDFDFIFFSVSIAISLVLAISAIFILKTISKKKTLHEGPMTGK